MTRLVTCYRRVWRATPVFIALAGATSTNAANECGPASGSPPTATCTTAGNPYPTGILYSSAGDVFINVDPGVVVDPTVPGPEVSAISALAPFGTASVFAPNVTIDVTNDPAASERFGIFIISGGAGDAVIDAGGVIDIAGVQDNQGIAAIATGFGDASITWSGPITFTGGNSLGIHAESFGGDAIVDASGDITGVASAPQQTIGGIFATTTGGNTDALIRYRSGTIDVSGPRAYGIAASSYFGGPSQVITDPGTTIIVNGAPDPGQNGFAAVTVRTFFGSAATGQVVTADIASLIQNTGGATPNANPAFNPIGIRAKAEADVPVTVLYSGPGITTSGGGGVGISAASTSGDVTVLSLGPIATDGVIAHGILADSGGLPAVTASEAEFPIGAPLEGAIGAASGVGGVLDITSFGGISTTGPEAFGIYANSQTGDVTVRVANTTTTDGAFGVGILATSGDQTNVNVLPSSVVRGGWQADPAAVGTSLFLPSAGVVLGLRGANTSILNNEGTIGALSDRAVADAELFLGGLAPADVTINNNGSILGYITLGSGNTVFNNSSPNSLDIRNFSDTDGDTVRDHKAVAVSDFGAGDDEFFNEAAGVVRLLTVLGATTTDTTAQFLPGGLTAHDSAQPGVEQGQLLNLELFENRGLITMQDAETGGTAPVAGDVLVITASSTAGLSGGGVFLSDDGALHLDAVLNEGGAASNSDILVVDTAEVQGNKATRIAIANAGGLGAATPGDGIKVVDVLEPANSDDRAFELEGRAAAGAFEYFLFQGGRADDEDGDWYLRTQDPCTSLRARPPQCCPPGARKPNCPQQLPAPPNPPDLPDLSPPVVFRPEIAAYLGNIRGALGMVVHTLHERIGEPQYANDARPANASDSLDSWWLRAVGRYTDVEPHGTFLFGVDTHTWLVQGGVEMADWSVSSTENDRLHLGAMVSYGNASTNASALLNPHGADSEVDGYTVGAYATWYENDAQRIGLYLDSWVQAGYFDNSMNGDFLPEETYGSYIVGASLEAGYAIKFDDGDTFVIEPQAQAAFLQYWQEDLIEANTTRVGDADRGFALTRLGLRLHDTWLADGSKYQPYLELNWWHDFASEGVTLNRLTFDRGTPADRGEVGLGLNVEIDPGFTLWANAEYGFGDSFEAIEGLVGAKFVW